MSASPYARHHSASASPYSRHQSTSLSPTLGNAARHGSGPPAATWLVVGASRGIGLEFVKQLLMRGNRVFATIRDPASASGLWHLAGSAQLANCELVQCDISDEESIMKFAREIAARPHLDRLDYVILNAGILRYPNRASEVSFNVFADHLRTNSIGPIITAQKLLDTNIPIGTMAFMTSDSASMSDFRHFADGFAAYAASKTALNQMLRHLAAELQMKKIMTTILALYPGDVSTAMSHMSGDDDIEGLMTPEQSVTGMLAVIQAKNISHTGTFWTWDGRVQPW